MTTAVLRTLAVRDFALVTALDIAFHDGLTVITGESGAGKSILLGALGLVLGERAAADTVRPGAARAEVSAEFDLTGHPSARALLDEQALAEPEDPGRCLVRRVVGGDGRSRAFVNGSPVTLQVLRSLTEDLIDIHGQHENQRLSEPRVQLALLDDFGADAALCRAVRNGYRAWKSARREAAELEQRLASQQDRASLLSYQLEELEALALGPGEVESVEAEHRRLSQAQDLRAAVSRSLEALEEDAVTGRVLRLLDALDDEHPRLTGALDALRSAEDLLADAQRDLRGYDESLDLDPEHLAELDARLAAIHDVARKHKVAPERLAEHTEALAEALAAISTDRSSLKTLEQSAEEHRARFLEAASDLSTLRRTAATAFAAAVSQCMDTLGIRGGRLHVEFAESESESGLESVEFHVTTNPKYPPGPLTRIASGGERARIALAIRVVAAEKSSLPCLVLDEADVGVGGTTADVVGRLLRSLAGHSQVICVTHAPQVAALGHHHLQVRKDERQDTRIEALAADSRVEELARMLAGADITDKSRDYARSLLIQARE